MQGGLETAGGAGLSGKLAELLAAIYLVALAGCVDAIGYLHLSRLFVSFMSGNSTLLAVALAHGQWLTAAIPAALVALYVAGTFAGSLVAASTGPWRLPVVLTLVAALLALALALPDIGGRLPPAIIPIVLAMGVQNATLHHAGAVRLTPTYVTGTLATLGQELAAMVLGHAGPERPLSYAVLWLGLITGATGGALSYARLGLAALEGPALGALCLAAISAGAIAVARFRSRRADPRREAPADSSRR